MEKDILDEIFTNEFSLDSTGHINNKDILCVDRLTGASEIMKVIETRLPTKHRILPETINKVIEYILSLYDYIPKGLEDNYVDIVNEYINKYLGFMFYSRVTNNNINVENMQKEFKKYIEVKKEDYKYENG